MFIYCTMSKHNKKNYILYIVSGKTITMSFTDQQIPMDEQLPTPKYDMKSDNSFGTFTSSTDSDLSITIINNETFVEQVMQINENCTNDVKLNCTNNNVTFVEQVTQIIENCTNDVNLNCTNNNVNDQAFNSPIESDFQNIEVKQETRTEYKEQVKSLNNPRKTDLPIETSTEYMKPLMTVKINNPSKRGLPIIEVKEVTTAEYLKQVKLINTRNKLDITKVKNETNTDNNEHVKSVSRQRETNLPISKVNIETITEYREPVNSINGLSESELLKSEVRNETNTQYIEPTKSIDENGSNDAKLTSPNDYVTNKLNTSLPDKDLRLFPCLVCKEFFNNMQQFKKHMRWHAGRAYKCEICEKVFTLKENLKRHIRIHTGEGNIACKICGHFYNTKYELENHMKSHTGLKSHACASCHKIFLTKAGLKSHAIIHSDKRPQYICKICDTSFKYKGTLLRHMLTHTRQPTRQPTKPKRHECNVCDKIFTLKQALREHMTVHLYARPYICQQCDACFKRRQDLRKHLKGTCYSYSKKKSDQ